MRIKKELKVTLELLDEGPKVLKGILEDYISSNMYNEDIQHNVAIQLYNLLDEAI